jgi:hypothetical protein
MLSPTGAVADPRNYFFCRTCYETLATLPIGLGVLS